MITGIKQALLLTTAVTLAAGGEISALAATKTIGKLTQVRVTKHTLTGKTTKNAKVQLFNARGKSLASGRTNHLGKFKLSLKHQNLGKLKFKLAASKPGYRSRTFTSQQINKAVTQALANQVTNTPTKPVPAKPGKPVKPTRPTQSTSNNRPSTSGNSGGNAADTGANVSKLIRAKRAEIAAAKAEYLRLTQQLAPTSNRITACGTIIRNERANRDVVKKDLADATARQDAARMQSANQEIANINAIIIAAQNERAELYKYLIPLEDARTKLSSLMDELESLDKTYVPEEIR
ncbi:hypothetical protein [Levilactobacillus mulengensis]|mgnify:CR=1 FL=1|uniref:hypothetical protein n=1 Tax=Levilactobacillus mulengensis TaxID=2486025 RepID=UPI000F796123|nr:hypothetical protein [Levilactobacillus mulengensis]